MIMKRHILLIISLMATLCSCEKVWVEDIRLKALDSIRGYYELESATWEGKDPVDLNSDGTASYDYYDEWLSVLNGVGDFGASIKDGSGYIELPFTIDSNADWGGYVSINKSLERIVCKTSVEIEGKEGRLVHEFSPIGIQLEFEQTGYGEFTVRKEMKCTVKYGENESRVIKGPVLFHYKRVEYRAY